MPARSIAQLSILLQSGTLDPVDLAEEALAGIAAHPDKAIFTSVTAVRARREAEAARKRFREGRSLGPLDGVPVAWKDLFDIEGLPTTAGSRVLKHGAPADRDAMVVQALAGAGMVSVGRVNMSEFAFSGLGVNPHYGTPRNPASPAGEHRIPGGSSSGSGVAVAAGLVPVSIGTDTGGSVRIPAAFNGVVGYKATRGRYSMEGVFPLAKSLDSLGPLCRTVQDAALVDAAMRGLPAVDVLPRFNAADLAFVIPETVVFDGAEPAVVAAFEAAVERLSRAGARIRRAVFPEFFEIFDLMARHGALVTAEAFVLHQARITGPQAADMDPRVVKRTLLGAKISLSDYIETLAARERLIAAFEARLEPAELVLSPTLPHVAPALQPLLDDEDLFFQMNGRTLRNTLIGNFLDWCGVSLPCGTDADDLPVGLLVSGRRGADAQVLAAAGVVEALLG
ncbi:amidase [Shinella zoogloeoides]|uniref:Indoleacetamide hydrolase n=2 Tax=Shinella zoogloeoides TaxID=352475 RepID=A0A6N8TBT7_SHIZO|nr:amidase [Shinella zoogloeoides]MXN99625.1 amidase [Shinella zoogloeoides]UEX80876.1 amidase [Shinella zoogloeoides]